jgi:alpha-L-rhamnosidase
MKISDVSGAASSDTPRWEGAWRGRWIWDSAPDYHPWWVNPGPSRSHFTYLRTTVILERQLDALWVRVTCDSRYILFVNGSEAGRGPVREDPPFLGYDTLDLAPLLRPGGNTVVALCCYYGRATPWWVPAHAAGSLGRGSFCLETHPEASVGLVSDDTWRAAPAPWLPTATEAFHASPPEIIDLRRLPSGLHDAETDDSSWPPAVVLRSALGVVDDRPPAAPYVVPLERSIPQLSRSLMRPSSLRGQSGRIAVGLDDDPLQTWERIERSEEGDRRLTVWDSGRMCLALIHLRLLGTSPGDVIDVGVGEELRHDGVPEIRPRSWVGRVVADGSEIDEATFFDAVGFRYVAVHAPPGVDIDLEIDERLYPRADGASFSCNREPYSNLWQTGVRTVRLCSTDAFLDCPAREQRAWVGDAFVQILVSLVASPDRRLVRRALALAARSRRPDGLLAMASSCDISHVAATIPDYSLHWIRALAAYWLYTGDEELVNLLRRYAEDVIERHEGYRGASGLLENVPGWVFIDWAQTDRDVVTGAHDALYVAALRDYATLPGASAVDRLIEQTIRGFEALWDGSRGAYVDGLGSAGPSRRVSQQTNAAAVMAGIVPAVRIKDIVAAVVDPGPAGRGGRLVVTATFADPPILGAGSQREIPGDFDHERDVVACQPFFCHFLHQALARADRLDLLLTSLERWTTLAEEGGTFQELWHAPAGVASRCHGWSATPTYDLTTHILGLRPLKPGFALAAFDPFPGVPNLAGSIPTPHGFLRAEIEDSVVQLQIPEGVTVETLHGEFGAGTHRFSL